MARTTRNRGTKAYDESHIQALGTIEGIRKRPGMYLGPTNSQGLFQLLKEVADNSVDEAAAGRNDRIMILVDKKRVWVIDNGAGIPVQKNRSTGTSTLTTILTKLHAGGKFDAKAYKNARGTHGVGLTVVNALTQYMQVWTFRNHKWWTTTFAQGEEQDAVGTCGGPPRLPFRVPRPKSGTVICFEHDPTIFDKRAKLSKTPIEEWAEITAYLNEGLRIQLAFNGTKKSWWFKRGLEDYLFARAEKLKVQSQGPHFVVRDTNVDVALSFTNNDGEKVEAYTNSSLNADGGVQVTALWAALTKALMPYKGRNSFMGPDLRDGIIGLVNAKLDEPQFSSQTKEKLVDPRAKKPVEDVLAGVLSAFFTKNKKLARAWCKRAADIRAAREEFTLNKQALRKLNAKVGGSVLPSKYTDAARGCPAHKRECYLVEGDSAGGSARQARHRKFQGVLPLKGKILNVMKAKEGRAFTSDEVMNILKVLGFNPRHTDPLGNLRIGRLILLSDSDYDGGHINTLILALIAQYLPGMFDRGLIYAIQGPRYAGTHRSKKYFGDTVDEIRKQCPKMDPKQVTYLKGWGEIDPEDLRPLAFDPSTRRMVRIGAPSKKQMAEFRLLMADNPAYRRELLGI